MNELFIVGEWVERRWDKTIGIVRSIERYDDEVFYYVELQRLGFAPEDNTVVGSEGAWQRHHRVHAHVSTRSRDCDGEQSRGHTAELTDEERCDSFGDLSFKNGVIANAITIHGYGTLEVEPEYVDWHEETDEGSRWTNIQWCEEACGEIRPWFRDLEAEKAGY